MTKVQETRAEMMRLFEEIEAIEMRLKNARTFPNESDWKVQELQDQYFALGKEFDEAWDAWNLANQQARLKHVFGG